MRHTTYARRSRARTSGRGFTLLELIVVMVVVAIVGSVAVVASASTFRTRQRAATRQLATELVLMRDRALATGRAHWAQYNLSTHTAAYFQCPAGAAVNSSSAVAFPDPLTGRSMTTVLNTAANQNWDGVRLSSVNGSGASPQWIGFDWLGRTIDSAGTLRTSAAAIVISATKGGFGNPNTTISVEPETGSVSVSLP